MKILTITEFIASLAFKKTPAQDEFVGEGMTECNGDLPVEAIPLSNNESPLTKAPPPIILPGPGAWEELLRELIPTEQDRGTRAGAESDEDAARREREIVAIREHVLAAHAKTEAIEFATGPMESQLFDTALDIYTEISSTLQTIRQAYLDGHAPIQTPYREFLWALALESLARRMSTDCSLGLVDCGFPNWVMGTLANCCLNLPRDSQLEANKEPAHEQSSSKHSLGSSSPDSPSKRQKPTIQDKPNPV